MNKTRVAFAAPLLLLLVTFCLTTCQKEYSYEGGASVGTAIYTLNGAGMECTGNIISGNYFSGVSLNANNTVELKVNVIAIGTYNLTTNNSNGILFSAAGTFSSTGIQTIKLTGSGTPAAEGNFSFSPLINPACTFRITVTAAPPVIAGFTLSGAPNGCTDAFASGTYIYGSPLTRANTITISVNVTSVGDYSIATDTLDGISFSKSGTFSSTGIQQVVLDGTGVPDFPRNLLFTISAGISTCSFNLTVRTPEPLATYVLESNFGTPNPCNSYTVNGNYLSNTPLNNNNTVSIKVFVTIIGNFTIATNTTNGMTFSYTGAFISAGSQYVILQGDGMPAAQGIAEFRPEIVGPAPLGGNGCAFYVTVQ